MSFISFHKLTTAAPLERRLRFAGKKGSFDLGSTNQLEEKPVAQIKRVTKSPGLLFVGMNISGGMYAEVVVQAAGKYNPFLKTVQLKDVLPIIASYPISLVKRTPLPVDVVIMKVDGRRVTFEMRLDLHGQSAHIESFLLLVVERLMPGSGIRVHNGTLVGEITLNEEPCRIPTPHNGPIYFLNSNEALAFSHLENFALR